MAGEPRRLDGSGDLTDRGLEFHQQDAADAAGTDVAAWAIAEDGDETFWAEPLAGRVTPPGSDLGGAEGSALSCKAGSESLA